MNISKPQQRTLHALAQGGALILERDTQGAIVGAHCLNHAGWRLAGCDLSVFRSLRKKRLIASRGGGPYRITREGLLCLRAQLDNRTGARAW